MNKTSIFWSKIAKTYGLLALLLFSTALAAQTAPPLGVAGGFAILGGSTVTNTGATTIVGDVGLFPGSSVTGFPPGSVTGTIHINNAVAQQAQSDLTTAYNNLAGQAFNIDLTGQDLGGLTLTPSVYRFSTSAQLTGTLTLNAQGNPNAVFIFQIGSTLTTSSNARVQVINGGSNCNVFFQVGSSATLGTGTQFVGNILALSSITATTGSIVSGRLLARNGAATLDTTNVAVCTPVQCPTITLNPTTLPNGALLTPYNQPIPISATGGTGPYILALTQGMLPNGLLFNPATGTITGTPTIAGSFNFTITATDVNNCQGSRQYTIVIPAVCPTITLNPTTLPNGALLTPYNQPIPISATGGTGPYILALTQGMLPNGLVFNPATGTITGTPTIAGSFNFTITATDVNNCQGSRQYTIVIPAVCPTITLNPTTLPNGVLLTPYNQTTISATGGTAPYTLSLSQGILPNGLLLNLLTGVIAGTPILAGTFTFTVTATDVNNCPASRQYTIVIPGACPLITVNPLTLPNGALLTPYNQTITATGGTAPYTLALSQGTLPNGLLFNPATGSITGTPILAGNFTFTITANDVNNCPGSRQYTIVIPAVCPVITVNPPTLPLGIVGAPYSQNITASGGSAPYTFALSTGQLPPGLVLSSAGASSALLSGTPSTFGSYAFTIRVSDANGCLANISYSNVQIMGTTVPAPALDRWSVLLLAGLFAVFGGIMARRFSA